jgi:DNA replication protein DnaC
MSVTASEPRSIQDFLKDFATRGLPRSADQKGFVQEFEVCEFHGRWPLNVQDSEGKIRWNQPGCPHCRNQARTQALVANADISKRFIHCSFDNYRVDNPGQQSALRVCQDYAKNFRTNLELGRCLIMRGNPGTGKNHLSAAIMLEIMKQNYTALRIKATSFLDEYWAKSFSEREPWMKEMGRVDLLVIDEIGRTSNGKAANDAFFRLIDSRYEEMKPTIVITNMDREALIETLGKAAYDRLGEGGGSVITFNWTGERLRREN